MKEAADAVCDALLSSDDVIASKLDFTVSPNPALDIIKITSENLIHSINVIDINGQIVFTDNSTKAKIKTLDISSLPESFYFISIKDDQGNVAIEKIVKN